MKHVTRIFVWSHATWLLVIGIGMFTVNEDWTEMVRYLKTLDAQGFATSFFGMWIASVLMAAIPYTIQLVIAKGGDYLLDQLGPEHIKPKETPTP